MAKSFLLTNSDNSGQGRGLGEEESQDEKFEGRWWCPLTIWS